MANEKVKENRLRRKLERMGYRLKKNRIKDSQAWNFGGYMVLDLWTNNIVAGADTAGRPYCMSFDDVEAFTREQGPNRPGKATGAEHRGPTGLPGQTKPGGK